MTATQTDTLNLLIVDDNLADTRLMQEAIRIAGVKDTISAITLLGPDEVLDILDSAYELGHPFGMVLLDLNMPRINGKDLISKIRAISKHKDTLLFVTSNSDRKTEIAECYARGADYYFQKPSDFERLIDFFAIIKDCMQHDGHVHVQELEARYRAK